MNTASTRPFLARHDFLIRRLHSLTGLVPVGAYMVVHLLTNASILNGPGTFQGAVYQIHSLGSLLPVVEWGFIFLPILFHGLFGVLIISGWAPNTSSYPLSGNVRFALQRVTGILAFLFIVWHVFQLHGWFHFDAWVRSVAEPLGGAQFRPYSAASSLAAAMQGVVVPVLYLIGLASCVFHLTNGIWTMGITWGVWTTPHGQRRANWVCGALGGLLMVVAVSAWVGAITVDTTQAVEVESKMYNAKIATGELQPDDHKRADSTAE